MFSKRLASFVKEQKKEGHSVRSIKKYLKGYGYREKDIEDAVGLVSGKRFDHKKLIIIAVILLVAALIVSSFYVFKPEKKEVEQEISLKVELNKDLLMPGENLKFNVDISSRTPKRYILDMEQSILYNNNAFSKSTEKVEFSRRSLTMESLKLPDKISPGDYVLEVKVFFNNKVESVTSTFRVEGEVEEEIIEEEPEEIVEEEEEIIEEEVEEIEEEIVEEEPEEEIIEEEVEDSFEGLTIWEQIKLVKNLSLTNPEEAEEFCNGITQESYKDQCFLNIAEGREDIEYCDLITNERMIDNCYSSVAELIKDSSICEMVSEVRSDYCYMPFVMDGDYSVCPKLKNKYLKQSCDTLSKVK